MPAPTPPVSTLADVGIMRARILDATIRAQKRFARITTDLAPFEWLSALKLESEGFRPLAEGRMNFIEQLNQSLTCLASFAAVEYLLTVHPAGAPYQLNLASAAGTDILGANHLVAAEVFTAVHPRNNRKLVTDALRVSRSEAQYRYVFFYSPAVAAGPQPSPARYPSVAIIALSREQLLASGTGA